MVSTTAIQTRQPQIRRQFTQFVEGQLTKLAFGAVNVYNESKTVGFDRIKYTQEELENPLNRSSAQEFAKQLKNKVPLFEAVRTHHQRSGSKLPWYAWATAKGLVEMPSRVVLESAKKAFSNSKLPLEAWGSLTKVLKASETGCEGGTGG